MKILLSIIIIWNVFVFLLYGKDKLSAMTNRWRISERTLIVTAFLLGGVGAFFGMKVWRHKTRHTSFRVVVPIAAIMTVTVLGYLCK